MTDSMASNLIAQRGAAIAMLSASLSASGSMSPGSTTRTTQETSRHGLYPKARSRVAPHMNIMPLRCSFPKHLPCQARGVCLLDVSGVVLRRCPPGNIEISGDIERFQDLGVAIARAGDYPVGLFLWSAAS
ncbi:MAG: hypothetical protein GDA56_28240 [Hormoscilla sp. GM7CHS1pb]|nr:hypothetical protein [Hormoscilla sp. GM7CHS1pb]